MPLNPLEINRFHSKTLRRFVVLLKKKQHSCRHFNSHLLHLLMLSPFRQTLLADLLILFTLYSSGSKEAQDLHTEGPGEERWSHPGAKWIFGAVSVSKRGGEPPLAFILIKTEFAFNWVATEFGYITRKHPFKLEAFPYCYCRNFFSNKYFNFNCFSVLQQCYNFVFTGLLGIKKRGMSCRSSTSMNMSKYTLFIDTTNHFKI